jgi:hypothetical protein
MVTAQQSVSGRGRPVLRFLVFLLFLAVGGGAFYGGMRYQRFRDASAANLAAQLSQTSESRRASFESKRAAVDADPQKWLADNLTVGSKPMDSKDPEFLYLYGRALMLTRNHRDASQAFNLSIANLQDQSKVSLPLSAEVKLAEAAAALKQATEGTATPSQETLMAERKASQILDELLGIKGEAAPK